MLHNVRYTFQCVIGIVAEYREKTAFHNALEQNAFLSSGVLQILTLLGAM